MRHMICGALAVALLAATSLRAADGQPAARDLTGKAATRNVDVVICLDVSNSMDNLIASAKVKLWDIVNDLAKVKPAPNLRVGLYSYGNDNYDPKIGWVRKDLDLTTDLDTLYQKLNALKTQGGTEYVTRVCRDALQQQKWAKEKDALRIIFVCGNEPASQDPLVKLKNAADLAKEMDVVINPIYCGGVNDGDAADWKEFAKLCGGRFANISQDRGAVAVATPMDKELADLSAKLNTTYVRYGRVGEEKAKNQAAQDANSAVNNVAAARAVSKAQSVYKCDDWDLVDRCKSDPKFDVKKLKAEELSEELKKLTPEQREAHVKKKAAEREALQKQINEVNVRREAFVAEVVRKTPSAGDKAFDDAVKGAIRDQATKKGFKVSD